MDKINSNNIRILNRLEVISKLDLNNYFNKFKWIFDDERQTFIDAGVCNLMSLDIIDLLLKQNRPEEELSKILEKFSAYNKTIQDIVTINNVRSPQGIIDEIMYISTICKKFIDYHTIILKNKGRKKLANSIKEKLRESAYSSKTIANILYTRLIENHDRFTSTDHYKFKEKIKQILPENNVSQNDRELVYLFMHQASCKPSIMVSRDSGIEKLVRKIFQDPYEWKQISKKKEIYSELRELKSDLYTFTALAHLY